MHVRRFRTNVINVDQSGPESQRNAMAGMPRSRTPSATLLLGTEALRYIAPADRVSAAQRLPHALAGDGGQAFADISLTRAFPRVPRVGAALLVRHSSHCTRLRGGLPCARGKLRSSLPGMHCTAGFAVPAAT